MGDGGSADLRNFNLYYFPVEEDDIIMLCSDGVHDNLDPQHLGKQPCDCSSQKVSFRSWNQMTDQSEIANLKTKEAEHFLGHLLDLSSYGGEQDSLTPISVVDKVISHCYKTTQESRTFMELNPQEELPADYQQYPGKRDHTTCVCYRVGKLKESCQVTRMNVPIA